MKLGDIKLIAQKKLKLNKPKVKLLGSGTSNNNYLVNNLYLIRVNANPRITDKFVREAFILSYLNGMDIGPEFILHDKNKKIIPQEYIIIKYIPGFDLRKKRLTKKMIVDLAIITAKLHNVPINNQIPIFRSSYSDVLRSIEKYINLIKKYGDEKNYELLNKYKKNLSLKGPKNILTIGHGDICQQNLVYHDKELRFIDFEGSGLADPAYDVADTLSGFGKEFPEEYKELYLKTYLEHRKDKTLRQRIKVFTPLKVFETLCWSVMHVNEIKKEIIKKTEPIEKDIDYVNHILKKCKQLGITDKKEKISFD